MWHLSHSGVQGQGFWAEIENSFKLLHSRSQVKENSQGQSLQENSRLLGCAPLCQWRQPCVSHCLHAVSCPPLMCLFKNTNRMLAPSLITQQ